MTAIPENAVEEWQDLVRLGRAWKIMETHGLASTWRHLTVCTTCAVQALDFAGYKASIPLDELLVPKGTIVWHEIVAERERAHAKHGATSMESCDPMADRRLRVLTEEVGEVARVLNDREHDIAKGEYLAEARASADLRSELIQVAAMAVAWIAALDGEALS